MRKFLGCFTLFLLLSCAASAELTISSQLETVPIGGIIDFQVEGASYSEYQYTLFKDKKIVFSGEWCPYSFGSYRPREEGNYTMQVAARDGEEIKEQASCSFQVTGLLNCKLFSEQEKGKTGLPVSFSVETKGAAGKCIYLYHVTVNTEKIAVSETEKPVFSYTPFQEGNIKVDVTVTDEQGNIARDSLTLSIEQGNSADVTGDKSPFFTQGGIRTYAIHMPGVWSARSEGDFFTISPSAGYEGDILTIQVSESGGSHREGKVVFTSGKLEMVLPVIQLSSSGIEEEVYFTEPDDFIYLNGKTQLSWMDAKGEKTFDVISSGEWTASCSEDFVTFSKNENQLIVFAEENQLTEPRSAHIELKAGKKNASLYIFQPSAALGANIIAVQMQKREGNAFADLLPAEVFTSPDADRLIVLSDSLKGPLEFSLENAENINGQLKWDIDIPLSGSGRQTILFKAENEFGSMDKISIQILVHGEEPSLIDHSAVCIQDDQSLTLRFKTTAAVSQVDILDQNENLIDKFSLDQAEINRCLPDDPLGRYSEWKISLPKEYTPFFVQLNSQKINVSMEDAPKKDFVLFSQNDGWWKDKAYRYSTLEHSGCAIFALSHALQCLGYPMEKIQPEMLAETYAFCLVEGGTMNSTLVRNAGRNLGFKTREQLIKNLSDIRTAISERGAVFSFLVVRGHIAAVTGMSEDGKMFHIVDSAPSASIERMQGASIHYQDENGNFIPVTDLSQIPGSRYYMENNAFGGLNYWLDASYVAKRGVRLIQPVNKD